jgi:hypothetical protein
MRYDIHPSSELVALFREKPFQGQRPEQASVLIIGNDANYSAEISSHAFFEHILGYHSDGLRFWTKHEKHHPFLLSSYPFDRRTGGVRYHANFAKLNFTASDAHRFSFVELLAVPTIGNTGSDRKRFFELMNKEHLRWLEDLVLNGRPKFVLINQTLARVVSKVSRHLGVLKKLAAVLDGICAPTAAHRVGDTVIFNGYSFSHSISNAYLAELGSAIRSSIQAEGRRAYAATH